MSSTTIGVNGEEPVGAKPHDSSRRDQSGSAGCDVEFDLADAPGHLIRRAQQVHTAVWAAIVGEDLTSSQFAVLNVLHDRPGIDQTTLSQLASLDTSTCQDIVARLKQRGFIERVRDTSDGRRWLLRLSEKGSRTRAIVVPRVQEVGEVLLGSMSATERSEFSRLLSGVAQKGVGSPRP